MRSSVGSIADLKKHPAGQPSRGATLPGNAACGSTAHNNSGHCWRTCMVVANNVQTRSNGIDDRGQPLVTMGGGALPLPMPTQPETLTATRVATKATSTLFIGVPLSFTPRDSHFVPRCTVSRPLNPMVHRLRRQCGTSKGTVSLVTQLSGGRSKTCPPLRGDGGPVCNGFAENPFDSTRKTDSNVVARPP